MLPRLTLSPIEECDPEVVFAAVHESLNELMPWMPWCTREYNITAVTEFQNKMASDQGTNYACCIAGERNLSSR